MAEARRSGCEVACLTPAGRGAVATIGLRGTNVAEVAGQLFDSISGTPLDYNSERRIYYGKWQGRGNDSEGEDVVVAFCRPDEIEIHCHGGLVASRAIVDSLQAAGAQLVDPQNWSQGQGLDALRTEALHQLPFTRTARSAAILLDQHRGALSDRLAALQDATVRDDFGFVAQEIDRLLETSSLGLHLTQPWHVAFAGPPNVGKSSLMNALLGYERAIVFDQPGTTRDVLRTLTALHGWLIEFNDTAGIRESSDQVESLGIDRAQEVCATADLVIWVCEPDGAAEPPGSAGEVLLVRNKSDLPQHQSQPNEIATSAVTGDGVQVLADTIVAHLVPREPASGDAVLFTTRQISLCEEIRAALQEGQERRIAGWLSMLASGDALQTGASQVSPPQDRATN